MTCRIALKEWAVVVDALLRGECLVILRKGGILERRGGFQVEHRSFFLFPTYLHQRPADLVSPWGDRLACGEIPSPPSGRVWLAARASVEAAHWVSELASLRCLGGLHPLSAAAAEERFRYGAQPGLWALILRVRRLASPHEVPDRREYAGCTSWVQLAEALSCGPSEPALGVGEFRRASGEVLARLRSA